jgi:ribonuclease HI
MSESMEDRIARFRAHEAKRQEPYGKPKLDPPLPVVKKETIPKIKAWFDGACEPRNPGGHAAWGILLKVNGVTIVERGDYVGVGAEMSNNVAEYGGAIAVLEEIQSRQLLGDVLIVGDSKLVIQQLSGRWRAKGGLYLPLYKRAKTLLGNVEERIGQHVRWQWIPREQNEECDDLSKEVLRQRGIGFRIQPEPSRPLALPSQGCPRCGSDQLTPVDENTRYCESCKELVLM